MLVFVTKRFVYLCKTKQKAMTTQNTIQKGQTLTARSIGDYNCIFSAKIIDRNKNMVTVETRMNGIKRMKVYSDDRGEYIYALGKYSMCPTFRP